VPLLTRRVRPEDVRLRVAAFVDAIDPLED
jgi:hypothetical protein